jgi:hypothetical protein
MALEQKEPIPKQFPLKIQRKEYSLHQVAYPNPWFVDISFFGRFAYYTFINANTRHLVMIPGNSRIDNGRSEIFVTSISLNTVVSVAVGPSDAVVIAASIASWIAILSLRDPYDLSYLLGHYLL